MEFIRDYADWFYLIGAVLFINDTNARNSGINALIGGSGGGIDCDCCNLA